MTNVLVIVLGAFEFIIYQMCVDLDWILYSIPYHYCVCTCAQSFPTLCDLMGCSPSNSSVHEDSPGKNTGVGCHALLQGIFPTLGSNPGLPYCRQILYCLSHQGSPRILEWVAYPFSRGTSWPRNRTGVPTLQEDSLPAELPRENP